MKTNLFSLISSTLLIVSCTNQEPIIDTVEINPFADTTLEGNITEDLTLDPTKIWLIKGRVSVVEGVTLTIPEGTILKATSGTGADASTLIIARGGFIEANGTPENPIIMTSVSDNIQVGGTYPQSGPSLNVDTRGLWGGLLILGKAPCSFSGDVSELQIEGIPTSDKNGLYGGNDPNDSSGSIQYVSIRHGGAEIGEGNEINGLTLGGVGSGTTIDNIEVIANVDDGVEFFGGTVNASNLLVWGQGDDAIDIDQGYSGTIDGVLVILTAASDHGLEIDGPEGSLEGRFTIKNATIIGATSNCNPSGVDGEMADFRKGATGDLINVLFQDFSAGKDVELDASADAKSYANGLLTFKDIYIMYPTNNEGQRCSNIESLSKIFDDKSDESTFESDAETFASVIDQKQENYGLPNELNFFWTFFNL